jgi:hypothetical protein
MTGRRRQPSKTRRGNGFIVDSLPAAGDTING